MNPAVPPTSTPKNGLQKDQDLKNSFKVFGLKVTLQLFSIYSFFLVLIDSGM
jgi:hypothetical protein